MAETSTLAAALRSSSSRIFRCRSASAALSRSTACRACSCEGAGKAERERGAEAAETQALGSAWREEHSLRVCPPRRHRLSQLHLVRQRNMHLLKHVAQLLVGGFADEQALDLQSLHLSSILREIRVPALDLRPTFSTARRRQRQCNQRWGGSARGARLGPQRVRTISTRQEQQQTEEQQLRERRKGQQVQKLKTRGHQA